MKIKIAGKYYLYFNDVSIATTLDAVASSFAFTAKYDPDNPDHQKLFRPLSFHRVQFYHDDDTLISTGTIVSHSFNSTKFPELVKFSGYSLGGVLEDCQIPPELYPLESNNRSLREITKRLLDYFGLDLHVYDSAQRECDLSIEKSVASASESIKDYISKVAAQKNVIFSHDIYGGLIFFRPDVKAKSKGLFTGKNTVDMGHEVNGQALHSRITTIRQPAKSEFDDDESEVGTTETVTNPLVKAKRPFVDVQTSGKDTDTSKGARSSLAAELKNIKIGFTIPDEVRGLSIGDIVEIQNDELFIHRPTRFMVGATVISEDSKSKTLSVTCVLPESFTGGTPKDIYTL